MHEHGCYGPSFDTDLHEMVAFVEKDHSKLYNRDKEDQHPIEAIEGLEEALENMGGFIVAFPIDGQEELSESWLSTEDGGEPLIPNIKKLYCLGKASENFPMNALFRWGGEQYIPVIADNGFDVEIIDPEAKDVLLYDDEHGVWKNYKLVDDNSLIYLNENGGLSIKHYEDARQGQMLVKDEREGLYWVDPVSDDSLQRATEQAEASARQAGTSAVHAGNYAADALRSAMDAEETYAKVERKFWYGTMAEYNALEEIYPTTIYVILDE